MSQWRTLRKAADETAGGGAPVLIALLPPSALGRAHLTPVSPVHEVVPKQLLLLGSRAPTLNRRRLLGKQGLQEPYLHRRVSSLTAWTVKQSGTVGCYTF